ncbi:MAG: serine/threonine protein kinase, partial [Polyangiaceae bacterium]|nr:serine/threonine protein kinase [Polyangiaceae bacterium]
DFGLARSAQAEGDTLTGAVLGTPHFMAPEQAHGEPSKLDRRADVYGLGATLYSVLTGQPPVPGRGAAEVLANLATVEPRPLRALEPSVPADLEAITLKCLEKDPAARYTSARALADDLGRFLDGEPVEARPVGTLYRLRKWVAKRRRGVALGAAAIAVSLIALSWGLEARLRASERERLAQRFTEHVERVEAMALYSALSPLHDTRGDREAIRQTMGELRAEIERAGSAALGPGNYALGRAAFALGDADEARERLEAAWRHGFREPRAAYALAETMGLLYRRALLEAERLESKPLREARKRSLERGLRDPALAYLAQSGGVGAPSAEYVAALIAFYEDRLDDALARLDAASGPAWFYGALALRGDIAVAQATRLRRQGELALARAEFERGRQIYASATAIGESAPALYEAAARLEHAALVAELYSQGDVQPPFQRGTEAAGRAALALPDRPTPLVLKARLARSLAEYRNNVGGDVEALLESAIADAQRAVALAPTAAEARLELAQLYRQAGEALAAHDKDPRQRLEQAIKASEGIAPAGRDYAYYVQLGLIFKIWADYQDNVGVDARDHRSNAIEAYAAALRLEDAAADAWMNLAINYFMRASQPRAQEADADLDRATVALDRGRALNPKHVVACFYGAEVLTLRAQRARDRGADPSPDLARAVELYREGLALNPELPQLSNGLGVALLEQARIAWDTGHDPGPLFDQARQAYEQAIAAAPEQGLGDNNVGDLLIQRALYEQARARDPRPALRAAVTAFERAIERLPEQPIFWANLGTAHAIAAGDELGRGLTPQASLGRAKNALTRALERNPSFAPAHLALGEALGVEARWQARERLANEESFAQAARSFERAFELSPDTPADRLAFGRFSLAWANWQLDRGVEPGPVLARALSHVERALAARSAWPDALVIRASLLLRQARTSVRPEDQRELARRARDDFGRALAANPNLAPSWRAQEVLAQSIATP